MMWKCVFLLIILINVCWHFQFWWVYFSSIILFQSSEKWVSKGVPSKLDLIQRTEQVPPELIWTKLTRSSWTQRTPRRITEQQITSVEVRKSYELEMNHQPQVIPKQTTLLTGLPRRTSPLTNASRILSTAHNAIWSCKYNFKLQYQPPSQYCKRYCKHHVSTAIALRSYKTLLLSPNTHYVLSIYF